MTTQTVKTEKIIIVGELNGWDGWREIKSEDYDHIIFMGNLTTFRRPFNDKHVIKNLIALINFKTRFPDKVHLLIGSNDIEYMFDDINTMGKQYIDYASEERIKTIIRNPAYCANFEYCFQFSNYLCIYGGFTEQWFRSNLRALYNLGLGAVSRNFGEFINIIWKLNYVKDIFTEDGDAYHNYGLTDSSRDNSSPLFTNWLLEKSKPLIGFNQVTSAYSYPKMDIEGDPRKDNAIYSVNCIDYNKAFKDQINNFLELTRKYNE